jgi:hypothetical protein
MNIHVEIGGVTGEVVGEVVLRSGGHFNGGNQEGDALAYTIRVPDGAILEVASTLWNNADRDVRTITHLVGPIGYDRLLTGCSLDEGQTVPGLFS